MKDQQSKRTVSTNNDGCEHLPSKTNDVIHIGLSDVERSEETGMRKRNWNSIYGTEVSTEAAAQSKQSRAENTKLLESRGHRSSVSRVVEDGSVCISTNDETKIEIKNAVEILQIFVSKRFSEVLVPSTSNFMLDTLKYLLRYLEDDEISKKRFSFLQFLSKCLTQWSGEYKEADISFKSKTAELSKVSELEAGLAANDKESQVVFSEEKETLHMLACLEKRKRELEEHLKVLTVEITNLTLNKHKHAQSKNLLLDKRRNLMDEWNDWRIKMPCLQARQEEARMIKENIEAQWSELGKQFNDIFMSEFGSS